MANSNTILKKESSKLKELSHSIAVQARKEMEKTGKVQVTCPKCGEKPIVDINRHRMWVFCPCRFVRDGEIFD